MYNASLSWVDVSIVIAYLAICLIIGLQRFGKIRTIRDYTLGFKPFPTGVLIATTFATAVSSFTTVGYVGKAYELGLVIVLPSLFAPLAWFIMIKLLTPNLEYFQKKGFMSFTDIMNHWYGIQGKWLTNICSVIIALGITAASITAIGYLLHYFLNIPEIWGMCIGLFVVTLYSAFGGIQAVAYTDLFQFLIFFVVIPIACAIGIKKVGGIERIIETLPTSHTSINKSNILLFCSFLFYALMPMTGIPFIQRALIARDKLQFKKTFSISAILTWPLLIVIGTIALITYTMNPNINSNVSLFYFIDTSIPSVVKGFMIAGVLAVVMSTQDSYLNATSSLIARDICKEIWPNITSRNQLLLARISCVLLSVSSMLMVLKMKSIIDIIWLVNNFWHPLIGTPFLAGLLGARISKRCFLILVCSVLVTEISARLITGSFDTISLMVGILTAVIVLFIGHVQHKKQEGEPFFSNFSPKILFTKFMQKAGENNFSLNSIYTVGAIIGFNYIAGFFALNLTKYSLLNFLFASTTVLFVLVVLNELWGITVRRYVSFIWRVNLIVGLLIVPSYMMIASSYSILWIANFVLSGALFFILTNSIVGPSFILCSVIASYFMNIYVRPHLGYHSISSWFAITSCFMFTTAIINRVYQSRYIAQEVHQELETKVKERTLELREALDARQEFLNKVSHEIRNPMQAALGIADVLAEDWDRFSPKEQREHVKSIAESSSRLIGYTSNILDLAKIEQHKFSLNIKQNINLLEIIQTSIAIAESMIIAQNKKLKIKLDADIKDLLLIECDQLRVEQIISNLLNNAIKYSQEGNIVVKVTHDKEVISISVIDNGVGIPDPEKSRVFEAFFESSRTKSPACGTGLGLAIVREMVVLHGGKINLEDNKPQGSIFTFTLPHKQNSSKKSIFAHILDKSKQVFLKESV